ncbi:SIR2 family protein [Roseomonas sp. HJA6]|uniref:SIR2 family protein n=1 Tax=Roseomonas alba TaxID=2846776 RepID=A0ABS7AHR4_9PROT|nr:SIR2 family protein [Neoroseomonas alba]MBW6401863.1 SIR2 family protein [Neoroseomonas alba]
MRLTPDGPELPAALVTAQERGEVLFVCGAGVSRGAGLPLFRGLVKAVYEHLGERWEDHPAEREVMVERGRLEAQYDRMLRALERRLAAPDVRHSQTMRDRIRDAVRRSLAPDPEADLGNHLCLLELSRDSEHRNRLLTTNFDTLFERAWMRMKGERLASHACQAMPPPRTAAFSGVLHLHGRLADPEVGIDSDTDLVLTSAEFGDAYLRNGWASRYLYDLVRTHVLVLVGYQAEDPPMRYLLEALEADRERYTDLKKVYAFAEAKDDDQHLQEALWRAKGVDPILYHVGPDGSHADLYRTLREWCRYAEDPTAWRRARLSELLSADPTSIGEAGLGEVVALLGHGDAGRILGELSPSAAWLPVLSDRGVLGRGAASAGPWIASRVRDPEMVRACAAAPPADDAWWFIERSVEQLPAEYRKAWRRIRRAVSSQSEGLLPRWYAIRSRAKAGEVDHEVRRAIVESVVPQFRVRRPLRWPGTAEPEEAPVTARSLAEVYFEPSGHRPHIREVLDVWPQDTVAEERLLRTLCRGIEEALEEARDADYLNGFDRSSFDVPSVADHPQNQYRGGFFPIVRLTAGVWARLAEKSASGARRLATPWSASEFVLFQRLYLHALTNATVFQPGEALAALLALDDEAFWSGELRRETMCLMAQRWAEFPEETRAELARRVGGGPPRSLFTDDAFKDEDKWNSIRDHMIFVRLARIQGAVGGLDGDSAQVLADIQARHPAWIPGPGDRDDFGSWMSSGWGPEGDPASLSGVADAELVSHAMRLQREQPIGHSDVWRLFCESDPERALRGLHAEADSGRWEPSAWRDLLWAAAKTQRQPLQREIAELVVRMPTTALLPITSSAASWLRECRSLLLDDAQALAGPFLGVWDRLAEVVYTDAGPDAEATRSEDEDLATAALNEPGGELTWALCDVLSAQEPDAGTELGDILGGRFDRAVSALGRPGLLARVYLLRLLPWLYQVAPTWSGERLLPLLVPSHPEARLLWRARLGGHVPRLPALFNALKPHLLALFQDEAMSQGEAQGLAHALLLPAIWKRLRPDDGWQIEPAEIRRALRAAHAEVRHQAAWMLWNWMGEEKAEPVDRAARWRVHVGPLFRDAWPLDTACRDSETSQRLVMMVLEAEDAFPDAVDAVAPVLVPYDMVTAIIGLDLDGRHKELPVRYPRAVVALLDALVDPSRAQPPRDLGNVLARCVAADPALAGEPAYRRLHAIARRLSA